MRIWGQRNLSTHFAFAMHINWFRGHMPCHREDQQISVFVGLPWVVDFNFNFGSS